MEGTNALVLWNERWIPFLDVLLLLFGILEITGEFVLPIGLASIKIDPIAFRKYLDDHYADKNSGEEDKKDNKEGSSKKSEGDSKKAQPKDSVPVFYNRLTSTVRTPGVELQKLIVNPTNLRGKRDNPTTELFKWIPYNNHYCPDKDAQQQLEYYIASCNKVIDDIGRVLGKNVSEWMFPLAEVDEAAVEDFLSDMSEDHKLLKVLSEISNNAFNISTNKSEWLSYYLDSIGLDVINNVMMNEESIRIMIEIIIENTFKKISMTEVNNNFALVSTHFLDIIAKISPVKFMQVSLILNKGREIDDELLTKHKIQLLPKADIVNLKSPERQQDLILSSFTSGTKVELENAIDTLVSILKPNGFILLFHKGQSFPAEEFLFQLLGTKAQIQPQPVLDQILQSRNLVVLSKISDPFGGALYLIRPTAADEGDKIIPVSGNDYSFVEDIKRELYDGDGSQRVWIVSDDNPTSGVVGMVNCLKQEPKGDRVRCVLVSQTKKGAKLPAFSLDEPVYKQLRDRNLVMNIWRDGAWGSFRNINIKAHKVPRDCRNSYINCRKYGDLSSFEWIESPLKCQETKNSNLVQIYYSALNFKDVMLATGKISEAMGKFRSDEDDGVNDCILGFEFSGRDQNGRRVCGYVRSGGMATSTLVKTQHMFEVPDHWTMEEAATVPVVYGTSIYALIMRAKLQKGESILIHSGTGGIGLAAIRIALSLDCEVFTTVGTDEKREYLKKHFPQIKPENIGSSRNLTFEKMIMTRTNGRGVDVVLNSLAEEKFHASINCVASGGRYVEIGKYDLLMDKQIGTKMFLEDISFHGVFLDVVFRSDPKNVRKMGEIMTLLQDGIRKGIVQPLDRKVFDRDEVEDAFRYMAKGIHIGKVLLKIRDEEPKKTIVPKPFVQLAVPTTYFYRNKVYIIIGGLGGFGIEIAKWIIRRGGRHIILTSRYGARTPYHHLCLKRWKKEGVDVRVSTLNVGRREEAENLIKEASSIRPIGGFFNSAVVLKDAFFDSQTPESFREVCESKASATTYLDELTRKMCPELDYFVCFSSISCGRGNAGQTNYGFANSTMERICEERRRAGLHGLAIQWGIIGQVGVVHRHMGDDAKIAGVIAQSVKSCVTVLDAFLQQDGPVVTSFTTSMEKKKSGKGDILGQIAKVFGVNDISEINSTRTFGDMGFDSMVGVEIKQLIESYCDVSLSMQEIQDLKIGEVLAMIEKVDSEKTTSAISPMIATAHINLPVPLVRQKPLEVLFEASKGTPAFILNIGDEEINNLMLFAETLGCPVYGLRWTRDTPTTDIKAVASHFDDVIRSKATGAFNLISNGISANVALEMVTQSEESDKRVSSLTFLYGSDDLVNVMVKENVKSKDPDVGTLCQFVEQFMPGCSSRLDDELRKHSNLEQRINTVVNFITSSSSQTINRSEISLSINDFMKKRSLIESYSPIKKISMDLRLFEHSAQVLSNDITIIKEAFERVTFGKIEVHRVCSYQELSDKEEVNRIVEIMNSYM